MRTYVQSIFALSLIGVVAAGCSKKAEPDAAPNPAEAPVEQVHVAEEAAGAAPVGAPAITVESRPFDAAKYPGTKPRGEVLGGFSFVDSAGENFVIFTRESKEREEHIYESTLHIHHVAQKDGSVSTVRTYVERVAECEFDVVLHPYFGEWSVSDVDQDGVGEASFAYRVDCVSDVSPIGHKAFVTEGGDKFAFRGLSRREFPGMEPEGGTYTADAMPEVFLTKAKEVWESTVALSLPD